VPGDTRDCPLVIVVQEKDNIEKHWHAVSKTYSCILLFLYSWRYQALTLNALIPITIELSDTIKKNLITTMHSKFVSFDTVLFVFNVGLRSLKGDEKI